MSPNDYWPRFIGQPEVGQLPFRVRKCTECKELATDGLDMTYQLSGYEDWEPRWICWSCADKMIERGRRPRVVGPDLILDEGIAKNGPMVFCTREHKSKRWF